MGVQLPSLAALAVLAVFTQAGIWVDGDNLGWPFGVWLVTGAVLASALVRRVGLWTVAPAPPVVFLVVAVGNAAWRRQSQRQSFWGNSKEFAADAVPWFVNGFPWLAASVGAALVVVVVRFVSGGMGKCRSSSTPTAVDG
ncbi:hypothetical protein C8D87_107123 [Lentzea atacamensis]|jgi:hypothetical protein|uniref:DUF6542 domain-containing protein n=1 Tax=Lentzea atacamensis TaxID=531938 RepID=A0ABX9E4X2_9PSEU|nr:DUF6542 domain-containing protein [Lentzea atacamensis]RAS62975.1 hypothetical protein C8D87_107123 [Lentzea atacamensis]